MTDAAEPSLVFDQLGEQRLALLVAAFYRQVPGDPILGPMYPAEDLAGAEERLRDFLICRCGGSTRYLETRGHPRLRMRHAPFVIGPAARDRWLELMERALGEVDLPPDAAAVLWRFLQQTAHFLQNATEP